MFSFFHNLLFFFFNDTATTEIYTLSLHDALPIFLGHRVCLRRHQFVHGLLRVALPSPEGRSGALRTREQEAGAGAYRSEEHTSELQSQSNLVCRLLLEKTNKLQPFNRIADSHYAR